MQHYYRSCTCLRDIGPIQRLPKKLDLRQQFWAQFPLLPIRRKEIPVVSTRLPTLSTAHRALLNSATCSLYFQDLIALLINMVGSTKFRSTMHHGMAHFVDEPGAMGIFLMGIIKSINFRRICALYRWKPSLHIGRCEVSLYRTIVLLLNQHRKAYWEGSSSRERLHFGSKISRCR
jgi:hypothetical protein